MFKCNADGINVTFAIKDFCYNKNKGIDEWCYVKFSLTADDWLKDKCDYTRILYSSEVVYLENALSDLINGKLKKDKEIGFARPDFEFCLSPIHDLKKNKTVIFVADEHRFTNIFLEWRVYYWYKGASTNNHISFILDQSQIVELRDYLKSVITKS